jgi:hypothetical protein
MVSDLGFLLAEPLINKNGTCRAHILIMLNLPVLLAEIQIITLELIKINLE